MYDIKIIKIKIPGYVPGQNEFYYFTTLLIVDPRLTAFSGGTGGEKNNYPGNAYNRGVWPLQITQHGHPDQDYTSQTQQYFNRFCHVMHPSRLIF